MPLYRIHRMRQIPRERFRWAAHTSGLATVKPNDYDLFREVESATPYSAWKLFSTSDSPLAPGDLLEIVGSPGASGELLIAKYIGFEPAKWWIAETQLQTSPTLPDKLTDCVTTF